MKQVDEFIKRGYVKQSLNLFQQFGSREAESKGIDWEWTKYFYPENWSNVGLMFDKANPGHVIPQHTDHFKFYAIHFGIPKEKVRRRIVFLEDWKSGHYFQLKINLMCSGHKVTMLSGGVMIHTWAETSAMK